MAVTARIPWHPPEIVEHIMLSPPPEQLKLSSRHPKRKCTDREREAELNRARVDGWRERQVDITEGGGKKSHPRSCCTVKYDGIALDGLVALGHILDSETGDERIVGEALSDLIAEALTPENVAKALQERDRRAKSW